MIDVVKLRAFELWNDPLHRNSFFLMASTASMAIIGFFFWIVASRYYTPEQIGLGSSLISIAGLLINISSIGMPTSLVRFLPRATDWNNKISTALSLTTLTSILASFAFYIVTLVYLKNLHDLINTPLTLLAFTLGILVAVWIQLVENVYLAKQETHWVFVQSNLFSSSKLLLAFLLVQWGGFGIFVSHFTGIFVALLFGFSVLVLRYGFQYYFKLQRSFLKQAGRFAAGNYFVQLVGNLSPQVLPALITQRISPESAGFYFLAQMITNIIVIIPLASSQSLLASGSHDPEILEKNMKRSVFSQSLLVFLTVGGLWIFGNFILSIFGSKYQEAVIPVLRVLTLGVFPLIGTLTIGTWMRVRHRLKALMMGSVITTTLVMTLSVYATRFGLMGVAWAYVISQVVGCTYYLIQFYRLRRR